MSTNIRLYDAETDKVYELVVTSEDAVKAFADNEFAYSLLFHAKVTKSIVASPHISGSDNKNTEETKQDVPVSLPSTSGTENKKCNLDIWGFEESSALIQYVQQHFEDLNHPKKRKYVWNNIATEMEGENYKRTEKQCAEKWKNLLRTYKSCKDNLTKSGRGPIRFMYYDKIDEFLGKKPIMSNSQCINVGITTNADVVTAPIEPPPTISPISIENDENVSPSPDEGASTSFKEKAKQNKRVKDMEWYKDYLLNKEADRKKDREEKKKYRAEKLGILKEKLEIEKEILSTLKSLK